MRDPRLTKLADVLVNYSVKVKKDQLVRINGASITAPLIVELFRKVVDAGGHPFVRMSPDQLGEIMLKHGSEEQLKYVNPVAMLEAEKIDCSIGIWGDENTKAMSNIDPKRMGISQAARKPIFEKFMQRAAEGSLNWVGTQY